MTTMHASTFAPRLRPLAAALATLCAISTTAWESPVTYAAALTSPHASRSLVVGNCNDNGVGSLREALNNAISDDSVDLSQLSCSKISLTTGALVFGQSNLAIVGPGQNNLSIDGGNSGAVLYHFGNGTLKVSGISIINGKKYRDDGDGGNAAGACIHAKYNVRLENVNISHCKTGGNASRSALGGAVWAQGYAAMVRSTISDSSAVTNESGYASGGGIYVLGGLYMRDSTIADNVASGHFARHSFGGGVFARGKVNIIESTISANQADRFGGLALIDHAGNPATLINSTVSGNKAALTGGVFALPVLNLYNSTIAFNNSSVWTDSTGAHFAAGVYISVPGKMDSTIISNNQNTGVSLPTADLTGAVSTLLDGGHNNVMFCDITCPNDTTNEDPGLHPLRDNGGPTLTHVPTPGVWDRFHGSNVRTAIWDQRSVGFPRMSEQDPIEIGALQINSDIVFVNGFN